MKFTKMHGLGNDYIYLNCMGGIPSDLAEMARQLSHRNFGIGGDGLICICASKVADFRMRMFNADGSEGAMCGNGIRCLGKYVYEHGLTRKKTLTVETMSGVRRLELHTEGEQVESVTVDMGVPVVRQEQKLTVKGKYYTGIPVSMGNPHFVVQVDELERVNLLEVGPAFERCSCFRDGVNTEFVRVLSRDEIQLRAWERGSGETLACGTGACAAVAALRTRGLLESKVTVHLAGGDLEIEWQNRFAHMFMTGPAVTVFDGEWKGAGYGEHQ